MKLLPLSILCATLCGTVQADEYRLNVGLFTDHYYEDSYEYNETSNLLQVSAVEGGRILTAATFVNSHYIRSYLVGYGREYTYSDNLRYGGYVAAIQGYEGEITTHYESLIFVPIAYANYRGLTINVIPAAYSIGFEIDF